jgi:hypothetical integral membrane protein (TIGR02206 family)
MSEFSSAHLAAVALITLCAALAVWLPRSHPGTWERPAAYTLAFLVFAAWSGEYVADAVEGIWTVRQNLPLQLTDAVSLVTIAALLTQRRPFVELVYFWALSAALQAVLTPDLGYTFPSIFYFTFFTYHGGAIVAACYFVFGRRLSLRRGALWRAYAASWAWAALAAVGDIATGGNYMFLRAKPHTTSLLNVLGPWPLYIAATGVVALALFAALNALARAGAPVESTAAAD